MGHEVFVSYKFSDGKNTKDRIMSVINKSGHFYNGEKGFCKLEVADQTLKKYLSDMIYGTTVTIVVISLDVVKSEWVDWEIRYSLENHTRNGRTNSRNGIVCVIKGEKNTFSSYYGYQAPLDYNWAYTYNNGKRIFREDVFPNLIKANAKNSFGLVGYFYGVLQDGSNLHFNDYCVIVTESEFVKNPNKYIEEAYKRSNDYTNYPTISRI